MVWLDGWWVGAFGLTSVQLFSRDSDLTTSVVRSQSVSDQNLKSSLNDS